MSDTGPTVAPPFPASPANPATVVNAAMVEAAAAKLRADVVAGFKALAAKVGKTAAYLLVGAGLMYLGHVL